MRILVLQHLAVEHPGVFREFWDSSEYEQTTVELDAGEKIPDFDTFDLLAVMGGPMDVWQEDIYPWMRTEKAAIRHWVMDLGKPYLGICLGHQLLAAALGGQVSLMAKPEVGLATVQLTSDGRDDPIFRGFPPTFETLQWHGAEVSRLPADGVALARNSACPIQAFRWGRWAYGFQYHMEITQETVFDWSRIPEYKTSLEAVLGAGGAKEIERRIAPKLPEFRSAAERLDTNLRSLIKPKEALL